MAQRTLPFGTHPTGWRMFSNRKHDPAFKPVADKVLERDQHRCQFCDITAHQYQEIINLDSNYWNNSYSNMATACAFCTACFFVDAPTEPDQGENKVVYLPEISQAQLNNLCQVLYAVMVMPNSPYMDSAKAIYHSLRHRTHVMEQTFGTGMSDASVFGQCMNDSGASTQHPLLASLRLMPSRSRYRPQIQHWATQVFSQMKDHMAALTQAAQLLNQSQ